MSLNFKIREATASDCNGIAGVIVPIQQKEFGIPITYEQQPDLVNIAGYYQYGAGGFWVAVADGKIVGTISLKDMGDRTAALRKMFVAPDYRGKDKGVAQALLDYCLGHGRQQGLKTVLLGTTAKFLAAHRFYEKNGFNEVDVGALPAAFPRMDVDTKFYRMDF